MSEITYEQLANVNAEMKKTDIKGKDYAEVPQRIKGFRKLFPMGSIVTEIISCANGVVVFKATALDGEGNILGTGHAYEKEGSTFINKTSYIENCETSAVGRALGMVGIGVDTSVASYEEVVNAMTNQNAKPSSKISDIKAKALEKQMIDMGVNVEKLKAQYKVKSFNELTEEQHNDIIRKAQM